MSEEANKTYTFEGAGDFAEFLMEDGGTALEKIKEKIPPISNLCTLRRSFQVKPCKCGGKNPKDIMARRTDRLNSFYKRLIEGLSNNFNGRLEGDLKNLVKEAILKDKGDYEKVYFKLDGEQLLEI